MTDVDLTIKNPELPEITPEQFHTAISNGEQWTVIEGTIYDLKGWFDRHPGGKRLLSLAVGTDGTANYYCYHPPQVDRLLGSPKVPAVGNWKGAPMPTATKFTSFYKEMRKECWKALKAIPGFTKQGTKTQEYFWGGFIKNYSIKYGAVVAVALFTSGYVQLLLGIVAAWFLAFTGYKGNMALIAHGADHHYWSPNNFINTIALHATIPCGSRSTEFFTAAHHLHHAFTRVLGYDQIISVDFPHWITRLSSFTDLTALNRNQKKTAAVLLFLKLFVVDCVHDSLCCAWAITHKDWAAGFSQFSMVTPRQPRFGKPKRDGSDLVTGTYSSIYGATFGEGMAYLGVFFTSVLLSPNLFYFWPLFFGWANGLTLLAVHNLFYWYRVFKQTVDGTVDPVSMSMHLNTRVESPSLKLYGHSDMISVAEHQAHDWGLQQTINSGNLHGVAPHEEIGAAWQIEHHLFPNLSGEWYPVITPIIERMCKEYVMPDGTKLEYDSLWYTVEREHEVAHKLYAEYATDPAGSVRGTRTRLAKLQHHHSQLPQSHNDMQKQALMHDLGLE